MKTWSVAVPITGIIYVTVEAKNEKAAIEAALQSEDLTLDNCESWNAHEQIVRGNVFSGELNIAEAELESEDEDEEEEAEDEE